MKTKLQSPVDKRMLMMLKRLPCKASAVPLNMRQFWTAEQAGLVEYDQKTSVWSLTPKGKKAIV